MLTIHDHPEQLTARQYEHIKSAFHYQQLVEGPLLLSIPAPHGYLYWHNDDKEFLPAAYQMLSDLQIKEIRK